MLKRQFLFSVSFSLFSCLHLHLFPFLASRPVFHHHCTLSGSPLPLIIFSHSIFLSFPTARQGFKRFNILNNNSIIYNQVLVVDRWVHERWNVQIWGTSASIWREILYFVLHYIYLTAFVRTFCIKNDFTKYILL